MGNSNNTPASRRKPIITVSSDSESDSENAPQKSKSAKSIRKLNDQLTSKKREIIRSCWETSRTWHLGERIYRRLTQRKPEWKRVLLQIVKTNRMDDLQPFGWELEAKRFEEFLGGVSFSNFFLKFLLNSSKFLDFSANFCLKLNC